MLAFSGSGSTNKISKSVYSHPVIIKVPFVSINNCYTVSILLFFNPYWKNICSKVMSIKLPICKELVYCQNRNISSIRMEQFQEPRDSEKVCFQTVHCVHENQKQKKIKNWCQSWSKDCWPFETHVIDLSFSEMFPCCDVRVLTMSLFQFVT